MVGSWVTAAEVVPVVGGSEAAGRVGGVDPGFPPWCTALSVGL